MTNESVENKKDLDSLGGPSLWRSQRESNAHASYGYAQLLMSLIQEWRALFKRPEPPFIFAQLPNYTLESDCDWPRLRDEQRRALTLWNTAMAVTEPGVRVAQ